ncbi:TPA: 5-formyltetrahydrofolate cyclo-ligase [Candidatus Sumerlaeota bacterium]|jgi:5-formyltetrahydrofolate cyclo-ligase|nr:5-formyltetrahydrofolate cyclo-ligase [Candidatus Sumerlaeota bacterium]
MESKSDIRRRMIALRSSISPEDHKTWSAAIELHLYGLPQWISAQSIMAYYAMPDEVSTLSILEAALNAGKRLFLPRCIVQQKVFEAVEVHDLSTDMCPGPLRGLMDPLPTLPPVSPEQRFDLVLAPGVAFSRNGIRLGFGAGMYDKFLALHPDACRIALAFSQQVLDELPAEQHDAPMHAILTEKKCLVPATVYQHPVLTRHP